MQQFKVLDDNNIIVIFIEFYYVPDLLLKGFMKRSH